MKTADLINDRLKNLMIGERGASGGKLLTVLKSDLKQLFSNYMYISDGDLHLELDLTENGEHLFNLTVRSTRLYDIGKMTD
ncbi:MAG: cell division topological specificity factor MinE [Clostridiales bacterium]|jgi:septum formation topological specificity factor MinE|nr:cell division topological specificity factor MinE [Clostridiales bacterium]